MLILLRISTKAPIERKYNHKDTMNTNVSLNKIRHKAPTQNKKPKISRNDFNKAGTETHRAQLVTTLPFNVIANTVKQTST